MTLYNWQLPDWPNFTYDLTGLHKSMVTIAEKMGYIQGEFIHLSANLQTEAIIDLMVEEAIKTSEIEGEYISRPDVRSSIQNKLGLNEKSVRIHDKRAQGISDLILDVRHTFKESLNEEKLLTWHLMLLSSNPMIKVGTWRTDEEPMQIVSNHNGRWIVHYEAPPAKDVPKEMKRFINWFNETAPSGKKAITYAPVRAAIAHLYFESIHPFEDGNGRIGRAIAEKALSQSFGYPVILSLSHAIEADKKRYYTALHSASKTNELTDWLHYFFDIILKAQTDVEEQINFILKKAKFFDKYCNVLNDRQLKVIKRMFKAGVAGFEGGISANKYMKLTGISKATATRDLTQLLEMKILRQLGGGRSVRYELNI